ncbi:hypothetical protein ACFLTH_05840 [Bacteroidota bacterium]
MKKIVLLLMFTAMITTAQDLDENTNTFFDDSETKEYSLNSIYVGGEVTEPGEVDLSSLPLHGFPMKELELKEDGKYKFIGSYFCKGYSLHDIISPKKVKKINESDFRPFVDLHIVIENEKGDKAVFSWGEIFYSKDNFKIILTKYINSINPSKMKMEWPLSDKPRIVCGNDFSNNRFIEDPVRIIVKSAEGEFASEKGDDIFAPEIILTAGSDEAVIADIDQSIAKRTHTDIGYGHGRGYKGINNYEGYVFKDIISANLKFTDEYLQKGFAVASAKDGYRVVFSIAEIMNRIDMNDFLLIDNGNSKSHGRYSFLSVPDFFVDRNVRSVEKFEIRLID